MHLARDRWYVLLAAREIPRDRAVAFRRFGRDLVFWRDADGHPRAAEDRCPHRWAKLSGGRVLDGAVECPFHGFRFDGDGACLAIPAHPQRRIPGVMSLRTLPLREGHGFVWGWSGPGRPDDGPLPFFDFEGFVHTGSEFGEDVACHYTRAIENQLDFPHLPFVHRNTIGRFTDEEMDVITEADGDRIRARLSTEPSAVEFLGPNLWRLQTGPVWQFLAMAPVDEGSMRYYARTYQPFVHWTPAAWLLGRIQSAMNKVVLRQDTPLTESQPPGETRLRLGEVLLPCDGPIIAYRRWREALRHDPDAAPTEVRPASA